MMLGMVLAALASVLLLLAGVLWWYAVRRDRLAAAQALVSSQVGQRMRHAGLAPTEAERQRRLPAWRWHPAAWQGFLRCAGVQPTAGLYLRLAGIPFAAAVFAGLMGGWLAAVPAAALAVALVLFVLWRRAERRRRRMVEQLPDFLDAAVRLMSVGQSLPAAMQAAAGRADPPLAEVLAQTVSLMHAGRDLDLALRQTAQHYRLHELFLVSAVCGVAMRFGGRSEQVLERMGAFMRDLAHARQELSALSAEVKLSAWVLALLPLGIAVFIMLFNREMFIEMWEDSIGWKMLVGAAILQVTGCVMLYRLARRI